MGEKIKLSDKITGELEVMIINNMRDKDRMLTEAKLASSFGVGRSTIRESLKVLASRGLIKRTNAGTFVSKSAENCLVSPLNLLLDFSVGNVTDLLELREWIEMTVTRLAVKRATPENIAQLERLQWELHEPGVELEAFQKKDIAFHNALASATGNHVLAELLNAVRLVISKNQAVACALSTIQADAAESHRKLVNAIKERNEKKAIKCMEDHIKIARIFHGYSLDPGRDDGLDEKNKEGDLK
jgi:DNA-binding FadR family transcriptional regulator